MSEALWEDPDMDISWAIEGRFSPWMESVFHEHRYDFGGSIVVVPCCKESCL